MSIWRRRVDNGQKQMVADLQRCGLQVLRLHRQGFGCPDILVSEPYGAAGKTWLVEIKTHGEKQSEIQKRFAASWRGCPIVVAETSQALLTLIGWGNHGS